MKKYILLLIFICSLTARHASAAIINVVDDGTDIIGNGDGCSLREAIINSNNDDQSGSTDCTAGSGADTIVLENGITYTLSIPTSGEDASLTGDLDILDDVTITATTGATIDASGLSGGGDADRVFDILGSALSVTISNITIQNGQLDDTMSTPSYTGAGIQMASTGGTLTLDAVEIKDNTISSSGENTMRGAGIYVVDSNLSITNSIISFNELNRDTATTGSVSGAGIYFFGAYEIEILSSQIHNNEIWDGNQGVSGGGAYISNATVVTIDETAISENITNSDDDNANSGGLHLTNVDGGLISNSLINANSAWAYGSGRDSRGGGLYIFSSTLDIINSTFKSNDASAEDTTTGGAIYFGGTNAVTISFCTFTDNTSGDGATTGTASGGAIFSGDNPTIINSILANNTVSSTGAESGPNCSATLNSLGNNLIGVATDCLGLLGSDITDSDPSVLALTNNGGTTDTLALDESIPSPAIDAGTCLDANGATVTTDQRGAPRSDGSCDIGAYEYGLFYDDEDGDTFGNDSTETDIFAATRIADNTDCNDMDAEISPDADELCGDAIDNNCNASVDEGFETEGDVCTSSGTGACVTSGNLECSIDLLSLECDAVEGDAETEVCDDESDNDCDGDTDSDDADCAVAGDDDDDDDTTDTDGDGVEDVADNCPDISNADQADKDADGSGDACDFIDDAISSSSGCHLASQASAPNTFLLIATGLASVCFFRMRTRKSVNA